MQASWHGDSAWDQVSSSFRRAGKTTAALAGAQRRLSEAHWESAFWADLCACWKAPAITHALLTAFGIAADTPDINPLQVGWVVVGCRLDAVVCPSGKHEGTGIWS